MAELVKEGWYEDPASRHEYRWFSEGAPTDLVKDSGKTSRDAISMTDPAIYRSMQLEEPPDDGPLLHTDDPPPKLELINIAGVNSVGYAGVINTAAGQPDRDLTVWSRPAGALERLIIVLPIIFGFLVVRFAPLIYALPFLVISLLAAVPGRWRRRRSVRRHLAAEHPASQTAGNAHNGPARSAPSRQR